MKRIEMTEDMYPEVEGELSMIFGPIGGGKTTYATSLILESCAKGIKTFASFPVNIDAYNEMASKSALFWGLLGLKSRYRTIGKGIFEYVPLARMMKEDFMDDLYQMTDCLFVCDEAYAARLFDSYRKTNMSPEARMAIYATRHMNRQFLIVAQRPNSVHVSSRALINRFFKCERPFAFFQKLIHIRMFVITEYQDMIDESVNEEKPVRTRIKFYSKAVFNAFNSKYMRGDLGRKYPPPIQDFYLSYSERLKLFFSRKARLSAPTRTSTSSVPSVTSTRLSDILPKT